MRYPLCFIIYFLLYYYILLYFILFFYYVYIVVPTTKSHLDLVHDKERHIAQLTRKLDKKEEIITTLQTQLQQYKQQNLPRTPQKTTGLLLL